MDHTKIYLKDLDSPRQELSNGGPGIAVCSPSGLLAKYILVGSVADVQSSCDRFVLSVPIVFRSTRILTSEIDFQAKRQHSWTS